MNIDQITSGLKNVEIAYPFDDVTRVYKVEGKMFAITDGQFSYVSLKNRPDKNFMLRTSYEYITTGYHLNKEHWITVDLQGEHDPKLVESLVVESYWAVVSKLPEKIKKLYF